jgi:hypothetical protein
MSGIQYRQQQFSKHGRTKATRNPGRRRRNLEEGKPPRRLLDLKQKELGSGRPRKKRRIAITESEDDAPDSPPSDLPPHKSSPSNTITEVKKESPSKPHSNISPSDGYSFDDEFKKISTKQYPLLPGTANVKNSCWLDAPAEALWAVFGYSPTHWLEVMDIFKTLNADPLSETHDPTIHFYRYLKARQGWSLSSYPKHSEKTKANNLTQLRNNFRSLLIEKGYTKFHDEVAFQDLFVSY